MAGKAFRIDQGQLRSPVKTPQGFLRVDGYVGRVGIYEYVNRDEDAKNGFGPVGSIRRELRPEEEVFREDVLAGFEGAPLTANHPTQEITANNVRAYEVGTSTTAARRDGSRVAASMVIKDPKIIARVESGELSELSPGYFAEIVKQAGTDKRYASPSNPEGRYDAIQRGIEINHLALVARARGGSDLRLRLDGVDDVAVEQRHDAADAPRKEPVMADDITAVEQVRALKFRTDELEKTLAERKDALDATITERDQALAKIKTLEEQVGRLNTQLAAGAKAMETEAIKIHAERADAADGELAKLKGSRDEDIRKAAEVRVKAQVILGPEYRCDGKPDREIQAAVIKKFAPKEDVSDTVSAAFIAARFDSLVEAHMQNARSLTRASEVLSVNEGGAERAVRTDSREARQKAWREQALTGGYQAGNRQKDA